MQKGIGACAGLAVLGVMVAQGLPNAMIGGLPIGVHMIVFAILAACVFSIIGIAKNAA